MRIAIPATAARKVNPASLVWWLCMDLLPKISWRCVAEAYHSDAVSGHPGESFSGTVKRAKRLDQEYSGVERHTMSQRTFSIIKPDAVRKGSTAAILAM